MTEQAMFEPALCARSRVFDGLRTNSRPPADHSWRPRVFRPSLPDERRQLEEWLTVERADVDVFDTLALQLRDLIRARHPDRKLGCEDLEGLVSAHLHGVDAFEYGAWIHYPWSRRLVHTLDAAEFIELRTNRNRYKITPNEQAALSTTRVGIVGLSAGHAVALTLALERACGELRLADFDALDLSNLNRIRTGIHGLGLPKTFITAREIAEIDPYLPITLFPDGVTRDNVESFLLGGGRLDAVVDECDSLDIKVVLRDRARQHRIPVVMQTSDRGMLDVERFDREPNRRLFHGLAGDLNPADLAGLSTEQKIPYVLRIIGADTMSSRLRASMLEIDQTISTWPQLGSEVTHGGAAAADAVRRILLGQHRASGRRFVGFDRQSRDGRAHGAVAAHKSGRVSRACTDALTRQLVREAALAPSGGNAQPWQWVARDDALDLFLDASQSGGLIDFERAGSYVALGCAAESLVLAAHAAGREVLVQWLLGADFREHVATFQLSGDARPGVEGHDWDGLHIQMPRRRTTRRFSDRRPLPADTLTALTHAVRSVPGCDVQWIVDEADRAEISALIGSGDRLRLLFPPTHAELFAELRWTKAQAEGTGDGIDVATLGLSESDRAGLMLCRDPASLELVRQWGGGRNLEKLSRKQVARASAVGLITSARCRPIDYAMAGRAVQRMWLVATRDDVAVHPMATLPYFFARLVRGGGKGLDNTTLTELRALRPRYERLFRLGPTTGEALLFCLGFGDGEPIPSRRRALDDVLHTAQRPANH